MQNTGQEKIMVDMRTIQRCIDQGLAARELRLYKLDMPSTSVQRMSSELHVVCAANVDLTRDKSILDEARHLVI